MLDQSSQIHDDLATTLDGTHFDLVVIGAGISGLNALYAASHYLPKGAKALLLDQKASAGGMWTIAYDYVRLHQPHPMFTVGDMKWKWRKPKDYLASRNEVQSHLETCLTAIAAKLHVTMGFGQTVASFHEIATPSGHLGEVTFHANGIANSPGTVTADQIIHATGFNYQPPQPLEFSSQKVRSFTPDDLNPALADSPDAPVYVIGGGKTGMDTILELLRQNAHRKVTLLAGKGTDFFNRTQWVPTGLRRWTRGQVLSRTFHTLAMRFDGDNEADLSHFFKSTYATELGSGNQQFLYGLMSEDEQARVQSGLEAYVYDYLEDISDTAAGPVMHLRSGETCAIPEGSLIVNCTGNVLRGETPDANYPCLSKHGRVLSINVRDSMHFLTSVAGFFLPHMHYRGLLRDSGFYMINQEELFQKNRTAWIGATSTQAYLNQTLAVQALPLTLLDKCNLDFDRWYPLPRRMAALLKMKTGAARELPHCRKALDRVAKRFNVHCTALTAE